MEWSRLRGGGNLDGSAKTSPNESRRPAMSDASLVTVWEIGVSVHATPGQHTVRPSYWKDRVGRTGCG
jgi:hypothetical protein